MSRSVLVTLLAFSLAVNAATAGSLIFFWARAHATPTELSVGQKPMKKFLKEDLGLTPEQLFKIIGLIDEKRPDIVELKRRFGQTRNEMKYLVTADTINEEAVMQKVRDLNTIHARIREISIGTVATLAKSLPPNAKGKFAQYIRNSKPGSGTCAPGRGGGPYSDVRLGN
jgi:Spy/CpxP family protein refolding chaperone